MSDFVSSLVVFLQDDRVNVFATDKDGCTALHIAAQEEATAQMMDGKCLSLVVFDFDFIVCHSLTSFLCKGKYSAHVTLLPVP